MATQILEQQKLETLLRTPSETSPHRRGWMIPAAALIVLAAAPAVRSPFAAGGRGGR